VRPPGTVEAADRFPVNSRMKIPRAVPGIDLADDLVRGNVRTSTYGGKEPFEDSPLPDERRDRWLIHSPPFLGATLAVTLVTASRYDSGRLSRVSSRTGYSRAFETPVRASWTEV